MSQALEKSNPRGIVQVVTSYPYQHQLTKLAPHKEMEIVSSRGGRISSLASSKLASETWSCRSGTMRPWGTD